MIEINIKDIISKIDKNNEIKIPQRFADRGGDGVLGHSIEESLGIAENNDTRSDTASFEIKTKKDKSNAKTTLFNCGRRGVHWSIDKYFFQKKYGTGYIDISSNANCHGLKLDFINDEVQILDTINKIVYYKIKIAEIENIIKKKLKNLMFVEASKTKEQTFKIQKLNYYKSISVDNFLSLMKDGKIVICSNVGSGGHDRGTQFRISKQNIYKIYKEAEEFKWK